MKELWKPVPYEPFDSKYLVSNFGRIKPIKRSNFSRSKNIHLKTTRSKSMRYAVVTVRHNGLYRQIRVHRAVGLAFLAPPPKGKNLVCHKDSNVDNNNANNLYWGDHTDNMSDKASHGSNKGERNAKAKITAKDVLDIRLRYERGKVSQTELAKLYGVGQTQISHIILRQHWSHIL